MLIPSWAFIANIGLKNNELDYPSGAAANANLPSVEPRVGAYSNFNPYGGHFNPNPPFHGDLNAFFYRHFNPNPASNIGLSSGQTMGHVHSNASKSGDNSSSLPHKPVNPEPFQRLVANLPPNAYAGVLNQAQPISQSPAGQLSQNVPPNHHNLPRGSHFTGSNPLFQARYNPYGSPAPHSNRATPAANPPRQTQRPTVQNHNSELHHQFRHQAASDSRLSHDHTAIDSEHVDDFLSISAAPSPSVGRGTESLFEDTTVAKTIPSQGKPTPVTNRTAKSSNTDRHQDVLVPKKKNTSEQLSSEEDEDSKSSGSDESGSHDSAESSEEEENDKESIDGGEAGGERTENAGQKPGDADLPLADPGCIPKKDWVEFFGRDRRHNIFLRPHKPAATFFKQRASGNTLKYIRILEEQQKLTTEQLRAVYTDYPSSTTYLSLNTADQVAWHGICEAVNHGHEKFAFIPLAYVVFSCRISFDNSPPNQST